MKRGGRNSSGVPLTWLSECQCVFGGKGDKEMTLARAAPGEGIHLE